MSNGFIVSYLSTWSLDKARSVIEALAADGIGVTHPCIGTVFVIDVTPATPYGEDVYTDESGLTQRLLLADRDEQNFKFWLDADTNLFCLVRRLAGDAVALEFDLDGLGSGGIPRVVDVVARMSLSDADLIGLVIDISGGSDGCDWDQIIANASGDIEIIPDLVVVRRAAGERLRATALSKYSTPTLIGNDLVAFDRSNLLLGQ